MRTSIALDGEDVARVDVIAQAAVDQRQVPGVVAAVARGDDVHVTTAGLMAVDGPPMQRDTLFRITSMTKPMTAAVVLTFIDEGVLSLNDPVDHVLPELADRRVLRSPDGPLADTVPAERQIAVEIS